MRRISGLTKVLLILVFLVLCGEYAAVSAKNSQINTAPRAIDGELDLTGWSWEKDGIAAMSGEWDFEWLAQNIQPDRARDAYASTMEVPGTWGGRKLHDGTKMDNRGYGIYRLVIRHQPMTHMMAIRLPNISTAYTMYIDYEPVLTLGQAGINSTTTIPAQKPSTVFFTTDRMQTIIHLVVSNFDHRKGGIRTKLVMGTANEIEQLAVQENYQVLVMFGCLMMIGFYHLGLFLLRRQDKANLFFALLCFLVAVRMGLLGESFLQHWFPWMDWDMSTRLEYMALALGGWAGFSYLQRMYTHEISRKWFIVGTFLMFPLVSATITLPTYQLTLLLTAYQVYVLIFAGVALIGLLIAAARRREGSLLVLIGVAGFVVAIVNDMLFYSGWHKTIDLVPLGLLFLIVLNSFTLFMRIAQTYDRAERLSGQLTEWNATLEQRIEARTAELHKSNLTLAEAKNELERMEHSRKQLLSNISHDLRTPMTLLQGYLEALRDDVITDQAEREAKFRLMLTRVKNVNELIQDLFELSLLETRKVELSLEERCLKEWQDQLCEQYADVIAEKGIDFVCRPELEQPENVTLYIDVHRMNRVFANLIYNAINYTPAGGRIVASMKVYAEEQEVEVTIEDNGVGISPEDLPYIFDRFYKNTRSSRGVLGGSGLGLSIAKEIVEMHGGRIGAERVETGGSRFVVRLPLSGVSQ